MKATCTPQRIFDKLAEASELLDKKTRKHKTGMVHAFDLLDFSSIFVKPNHYVILTIDDLMCIANCISERFASIDFETDEQDMKTFQKKYPESVTLGYNCIKLSFNLKQHREIKKLQSPYMESEIKQYLKPWIKILNYKIYER